MGCGRDDPERDEKDRDGQAGFRARENGEASRHPRGPISGVLASVPGQQRQMAAVDGAPSPPGRGGSPATGGKRTDPRTTGVQGTLSAGDSTPSSGEAKGRLWKRLGA